MRLSRIACLGLTALLIVTSAGAQECVFAPGSTDAGSLLKRVEQGTAWSVVEYGGRIAIVRTTGETLSQTAGNVFSVGVGVVIASGFGWWDAKHAPEEEKIDAFFDAFIRSVPGNTVTYRETYKAVSSGLILAVLKSKKDDPIRSSWLGHQVLQALKEGRIKLVPRPPPPAKPKSLADIIHDGLVASVKNSTPGDPIRSSWLGQQVALEEAEQRELAARQAARQAAYQAACQATWNAARASADSRASEKRDKVIFVHAVSPEESAKILKSAAPR